MLNVRINLYLSAAENTYCIVETKDQNHQWLFSLKVKREVKDRSHAFSLSDNLVIKEVFMLLKYQKQV